MQTIFTIVSTAIFGSLCFRLIYERAEEIAVWLVVQQCKLLPEEMRLDLEPELTAMIYDVNGGAHKLLQAVGCVTVVAPARTKMAITAGRAKTKAFVDFQDRLVDLVKNSLVRHRKIITKILAFELIIAVIFLLFLTTWRIKDFPVHPLARWFGM